MIGVSRLFHRLIPRDPRRQARWRTNILTRLEKCSEHGANRQAILAACRHDILLWINLFVWQFNPKAKGSESKFGPFATWKFQDRAVRRILRAISYQHKLVIEKSREMGASWMCLIVMLWHVLFHPGNKFLLISRDMDAVDCKDPDSLFWKLRFIIEHLPDWMKPPLTITKGYIGNDALQSYITGEASTGKAGIGGRATAIFVDEFTLIDAAKEIYEHTADTSACRIFNFTHRGVGSVAADLCLRSDIEKVQMHWSQHPKKNKGLYRFDQDTKHVRRLDTHEFPDDYPFILDGSPAGGPYPGLRSVWYDAQCRDRSPRAIAMDLDINPEGSSAQYFDPILINQLLRESVSAPWFEGDLIHDEQTGQPIKFEERKGGLIKLWCRLDLRGKPDKSHYFIGTDIGTGSGSTPTCFSIFNGDLGEKVGEVSSAHLKAHQAAPLAAALGRLFYEARIVWELQGPGATFGDILIDDMAYPNFYLRTDETRLDKKYSEGGKPGFIVNPPNKRKLLEDYREALRLRNFVNHSEDALRECLSFQYDPSGNPVHAKEKSKDETAARINHGDRVIADALAWKLARLSGLGKYKKPPPPPAPPLKVLSPAWREMYHKWREQKDKQMPYETPSYYTG